LNRRYVLTSAAIALFAWAVSTALFLDLCNLIYQCGCDHLWGDQALHCNIHTPGARHCPWCSVGEAGYYAIYGVVLAAQGAGAFLPRMWHWGGRLALSLVLFPVVGGIEGLILGLFTGYWN